jgi:hypothetical protein
MNIVTIKAAIPRHRMDGTLIAVPVAASTRTGHCDETANFVHQSVAGAPEAFKFSVQREALCVT